jgi:hypothetical protein
MLEMLGMSLKAEGSGEGMQEWNERRSLTFKPFYELTISVPNYCDACGKQGSSTCSRCHAGCYGSVDCQRKHWKSHKIVC